MLLHEELALLSMQRPVCCGMAYTQCPDFSYHHDSWHRTVQHACFCLVTNACDRASRLAGDQMLGLYSWLAALMEFCNKPASNLHPLSPL